MRLPDRAQTGGFSHRSDGERCTVCTLTSAKRAHQEGTVCPRAEHGLHPRDSVKVFSLDLHLGFQKIKSMRAEARPALSHSLGENPETGRIKTPERACWLGKSISIRADANTSDRPNTSDHSNTFDHVRNQPRKPTCLKASEMDMIDTGADPGRFADQWRCLPRPPSGVEAAAEPRLDRCGLNFDLEADGGLLVGPEQAITILDDEMLRRFQVSIVACLRYWDEAARRPL